MGIKTQGFSCPFAQPATTKKAEDIIAEASSPNSTTDAKHVSSPQASGILEKSITNCPAFRNTDVKGGKIKCPFREASNADELCQKMLSVPKSHWQSLRGSSSSDGSSPSFDSSSVTSATTTTTSDEDRFDDDAGAQFRMLFEHMHVVSKTLHPNSVESTSEARNKMHDIKLIEIPFGGNGACPFKAYYHAIDGGKENNQELIDSFRNIMEDFSLAAIMAKMASPPPTNTMPNAEIKLQENEKDASSASATATKERLTLSTALKKGTQSSHKAAENVHFVRNFIKGKINRNLYATLICNLYFIYHELELLLDEYAPAHFPKLHKPRELRRTESLERDVWYFYDKEWKTTVKPLPATVDYIQRLHSVAQNDPLLLLSHAYTRYLGDLSGGRVLQRVAKKALQLQEKKLEEMVLTGLDFYNFDNISNPKAFKKEYRLALDQMDFLSESQISKLVGEANVAFVLNMRVFEELDVMAGDVEGASVRPLEEALAFFDQVSLNEENRENAKCPFMAPNKSAAKSNTGKVFHSNPSTTKTSQITNNNKGTDGKRCPWPFVFFHDPMQGMRDRQTWILIALVCSWIYHEIITNMEAKEV